MLLTGFDWYCTYVQYLICTYMEYDFNKHIYLPQFLNESLVVLQYSMCSLVLAYWTLPLSTRDRIPARARHFDE